MNKERRAWSAPGIPVAIVLIAVTVALSILLVWYAINVLTTISDDASALWPVLGFVAIILALCFVAFLFGGLTPVNPNEARVLVLFGRYDGTVREQGLHWVNPLTERRKISVRVRNFETSRLKVNDHDGNPIEIAAVVVWKVTDTAEALFEVDDFEHFVHVQAESALRNLATTHPYDKHIDEDVALRSNQVEIAGELRTEIQDRLLQGRRRGHRGAHQPPAYAAEIANAMLRRQQANAVIAAPHADRRGRRGHGRDGPRATLRQERRRARRGAQGPDGQQPARRPVLEHETQPVVNTGSLYA